MTKKKRRAGSTSTDEADRVPSTGQRQAYPNSNKPINDMRAGNPALPSRPSFSNGNESDAAVFAIGFSAEVAQADIDGLISIVAATLTVGLPLS